MWAGGIIGTAQSLLGSASVLPAWSFSVLRRLGVLTPGLHEMSREQKISKTVRENVLSASSSPPSGQCALPGKQTVGGRRGRWWRKRPQPRPRATLAVTGGHAGSGKAVAAWGPECQERYGLGWPGSATRRGTREDWRPAHGPRGGWGQGCLGAFASEVPFPDVAGALDFEHIEEQAEGIFGGRKVSFQFCFVGGSEPGGRPVLHSVVLGERAAAHGVGSPCALVGVLSSWSSVRRPAGGPGRV